MCQNCLFKNAKTCLSKTVSYMRDKKAFYMVDEMKEENGYKISKIGKFLVARVV